MIGCSTNLRYNASHWQGLLVRRQSAKTLHLVTITQPKETAP